MSLLKPITCPATLRCIVRDGSTGIERELLARLRTARRRPIYDLRLPYAASVLMLGDLDVLVQDRPPGARIQLQLLAR